MTTATASLEPDALTRVLIDLALVAGREIMTIYCTDFATRAKQDLTPVTEADEVAERVILAGLAQHDPATPVVSEEAAAAGRIPGVGNSFYLVDPLDGTKEFVSRNGEFTVNIARIENGQPVAGVVYAPAIHRLFWGRLGLGCAEGQVIEDRVAYWSPCHVRARPAQGLTVVASRSHRDAATDSFLKGVTVEKLVSAGSSLKFCLIAAGEADLYPRFGRTMEWDTAAGQAVLAAAGGKVTTIDGKPLCYGKCERGFDNPGFIASAG
jgi:3'(2'), 5'-bisphosphate nucleotidase